MVRIAWHWAPSFASEGLFFHFILNAFWEPLNFELPMQNAGSSWRRWIDTVARFTERHRFLGQGTCDSRQYVSSCGPFVVMLYTNKA